MATTQKVSGCLPLDDAQRPTAPPRAGKVRESGQDPELSHPRKMPCLEAELRRASPAKKSQGPISRERTVTTAVPLCTSASLRLALGNTAKILITQRRSGTLSV